MLILKEACNQALWGAVGQGGDKVGDLVFPVPRPQGAY